MFCTGMYMPALIQPTTSQSDLCQLEDRCQLWKNSPLAKMTLCLPNSFVRKAEFHEVIANKGIKE